MVPSKTSRATRRTRKEQPAREPATPPAPATVPLATPEARAQEMIALARAAAKLWDRFDVLLGVTPNDDHDGALEGQVGPLFQPLVNTLWELARHRTVVADMELPAWKGVVR